MSVSPQLGAGGPVRVSIVCNGQAAGDDVLVYSVLVRRKAGQVASARLIIADGEMTTGQWAIADQALFAPGAVITVKAGYGDTEESIFTGIVVRLGVRIVGDNVSRLVVDCQDKAVKLTVGRRNANFVDKSDSDIIAEIAKAHGLESDVEATRPAHMEIVQYYCTDWDFLVSRADVNGLLVITEDGKLIAKAPDPSAEPALEVTWGADLMEFHADLDARG